MKNIYNKSSLFILLGNLPILFFFLNIYNASEIEQAAPAKTERVTGMDYYWVGGTGLWSEYGTHWATTSGGTTFHNQVPTFMDNVYFDANSFTATNQIVTIDETIVYCANMDWSGATNMPELQGNASNNLYVYNSLMLVSGMNYNFDGALYFQATNTGHTIESGGQIINGMVYFSGIGGVWQLIDKFETAGDFVHTNGTLITNGQELAIGCLLNGSSYNYGTPRLELGTSILRLKNCYLPFGNKRQEFYRYASTDLLAAQSHIIFEGQDRLIENSGTNHVYGKVTFEDVGSLFTEGDNFGEVVFKNEGHINHDYWYPNCSNNTRVSVFQNVTFEDNGWIFGSSSFDSLFLTGGKMYSLAHGSTQTIMTGGSVETINSSCDNLITLASCQSGTQATFYKSGLDINLDYLTVSDIAITGGATFNALNSVDLGNNNGWNFTSSAARDLYWVGGNGDWMDKSHWSLSSGGAGGECIPSPVDNVFFDGNSGFSTGDMVELSQAISYCKNMDWSGVTNSPQLNGNSNNNLHIYGSLKLVSGMNYNLAGALYFQANTTGQIIESSGQIINGMVQFAGIGGAWQLVDKFETAADFVHTNGTLNTNGQELAIGCLLNGSSYTYGTPRLELGTSTLRLKNCYLPFGNKRQEFYRYASADLIAAQSHIIFEGQDRLIENSGTSHVYGKVTFEDIGSLFTDGDIFEEVIFKNEGHVNHDYWYPSCSNTTNTSIYGKVDFEDNGWIFGINTFDSLHFTAGKTYILQQGATQTITPLGDFMADGNSTFPIEIKACQSGLQATFHKDGVPICLDYLFLSDTEATGSGFSYVGANSSDITNNTGWIFQACPPCANTPPAAPTLGANSVTAVNNGQTATLILDNLPANHEAVWFDITQATELYADVANSFQPTITQPTQFYGATRDLATGCLSDFLLLEISTLDNCITGVIQKKCGELIEGATVVMSGDLSGVTQTDANGVYKFNNIPSGSNVTITPSKSTGCQGDTCINGADVLAICQHILGISSFSSPNQYIAADINSTETITAFDKVQLRQFISGITSSYPSNSCFQFVDATYNFTTNATLSENYPSAITISGLSGDTQADFMGVQIGNVTDCCEPLTTSFLEFELDTLQLSCTTSLPTTLSIPVSVRNFNNVSSFQFSLNWLPSTFQYNGTNNYNLADLNAGSFNENGGELSVFWIDNTTLGQTIPDGTVIFTLELDIINLVNSTISFDDTPINQLVVDQNLQTSKPITENGYIKIDQTNCVPTCVGLTVSNHDVCQGDQICVDVSTTDFADIATMQYSLSWNPNILDFQQTQAYNLNDLNSNSFNNGNTTNGQLAMAWSDNTVSGISVPDGTTIYQICFIALQDGISSIDFTNTPTPIEFATTNNIICSDLTNGQVEVGSLSSNCIDCDTVYLSPQIIFQENCVSFARPETDTICAKGCDKVRGGFGDVMEGPLEECVYTCDSSIQVYHAVAHIGNTYEWKIEGGIILGNHLLDSVIVEWGSLQPASITLIETDINGCVDSTSLCIEFIESPKADFSYNLACVNTPTQFTDLSINADEWFWDFGDGTTSSLQHPSHAYNSGGVKTVTLIVKNKIEVASTQLYQGCLCITECYCTDTLQMDIVVDVRPGPPILCQGTSCVGDTACYTTPLACIGADYNWVVGANGTVVSGGTTLDTFICIEWLQGDIGQIKLSVSNCPSDPYCPNPTIAEIPIIDPNLLSIIGDTIVCYNEVAFYSVPKFTGVTYDWTVLGNGYITDFPPYTNTIPVQWYSGTGQVVVEIHHIKNNCSTTDTLEVNARPEFGIFGPEKSCQENISTYSINNTFGYTGSFNWNISGGTFDGGNSGNSVDVIWNTTPGTYQISAIATDDSHYCDTIATFGTEVIKLPAVPMLASGPTVICPGNTYQYAASATPMDGNINWSITGGTINPATGKEVLITWNSSGPYQIGISQQSANNPYCSSDTAFTAVEPVQSISISGQNQACVNSSWAYNAAILPSGNLPPSELINWTISPATAGSIISGQGEGNPTIQWNNTAGAATLTAEYCGTNISNQYTVTLTSGSASISGPPIVCKDQNATVNVIGNFSSAQLYCADIFTTYAPTGGNLNNPTFSVPGGCCYQLQATDLSGCAVTDEICILVEGPESKIQALTSLVICNGGTPPTIQIGAFNGNGYTFQWEADCGNGWAPMAGETNAILTISNASQACDYRCIITEGNCTITSNVLSTSLQNCPSGGCTAEPYTLNFAHDNCGPTINFISTTNNVTNLNWNFGEGNSSNANNPSHTYSEAGCYEVRLSGQVPEQGNPGSFCSLDTFTTINIPMVPDFDQQVISCGGGGTATYLFTDFTQFSPKVDMSTVTYLWTFTDACTGAITNSTVANPSISLCGLCGSTVPVTLKVTATDIDGIVCSQTIPKNISLAGSTPDFILPAKACVGENVSFIDNSCGAVGWLWDFGDGATSALEHPSRTYTVAPTNPTNYTVTLTVTDNYGCTNTISKNIDIYPILNPVTISPIGPIEVCEGNTITLTADPGFINYQWVNETTNATLQNGSTNTFTAPSTGVYFCVATDANNCKSTSNKVEAIIHEFPEIEIEVEGEVEVCEGVNILLTAPAGYSWLWTESVIGVNIPGQTLSYPFPPGSYTLNLTLTELNAPNCSKTFPIPITVHPEITAPTIFMSPLPACEGDAITIGVNSPNSNLNYHWSSGQTGTVLTLNPAQVGPISVTATNPLTGCSATSIAEHIFPLPDVCVVPVGCYEVCNPDTICLPSNVGFYEWLKDGVALPTQNSLCFEITQSGQYQVVITSFAGCVDTSDIIDMTIIECDMSCCLDSIAFCNQIDQGWTVNIDSCTVTINAPQFDTCSWLLSAPDWGDGSSPSTPNTGCDTGIIIPTDGTPQTTTLTCCSSDENIFVTKFGFPNYDDATPRDEQLTICAPSTASAVFGIITNFDLAIGDTLFVYDGEDTTYPVIGSWTGSGVGQTGGWIAANNSPYNNPSGCLTFRFKTNGDNMNASGWRMEIGCNDRAIGLGVNNYYTHTYDTSGTYIICATVYNGSSSLLDTCMTKQICDTITVNCDTMGTGCVEIVEIIPKEVNCELDTTCYLDPFCQPWVRNLILGTPSFGQVCVNEYHIDNISKAEYNGTPVVIVTSSIASDPITMVAYDCNGDTLQICVADRSGTICNPIISTIDIFSNLTNSISIWDCGDAIPNLGPTCGQNFGASYDYCIVVKNDNIHPAWSVSLQSSGVGASVTVSPTGVNFNPPLLPGEIDTIEVTLFTNTAMPGDTAKLHLSLSGVTADQTRDWFCNNQDTLCLILPPCPSEPDTCCDESNSLIANGAFNGYSEGNIPGGSTPWTPLHGSPRNTNTDGCDSLGCLQIWGNEVVGESIEQVGLNIQAGNTYRLNFCARYVNSHAQAPLFAQVEIRSSDAALPYAGCAGACEVVYTTPQMNTLDWQQFCIDWTPQNDYDRITIRTINGETLDDGNYVSRVRVDDVCLELIDECGAIDIAIDTLNNNIDSCCYALDINLADNYHSIGATIITPGVVFDTIFIDNAIHQISQSSNTNSAVISNINGGRQPITSGIYNNLMTFCFNEINSPTQDTQCIILDYYKLNAIDIPEIECSDTLKFYCPIGVEVFDCDTICYENPTWEVLDPGQFHFIHDIIEYKDTMYVAGRFSPHGILKWDGTNLVPVPGSPAGDMNAMAIHNGKLFVGGVSSFGCLASWDGTTWQTSVGNLANTGGFLEVQTLMNSPQGLIVGGHFNTPTSNIAIWNDGTQTWDTSIPSPGGNVTGLGWLNGDLVVGGQFSSIGNNIGIWNGSSWSTLGGGLANPNNGVFSIQQLGNYLYVGGYFSAATNTSGTCPAGNVANTKGFARWNILTQCWEEVGGGIAGLGEGVLETKVIGSNLIVAGTFDMANSQSIKSPARWDGTQWHTLGSNGGFSHLAIGCQQDSITGDCNLFIGGEAPFEQYSPNCDTTYTCGVDFSWSLDPTCLKVNFDTTNIIGETPIDFTWKFPDNTTSNITNPMWTAPDTGSYEICLEMIDANGCKDTLCQDVRIYDEIWPEIYCRPDTIITIPACEGGVNINFDLPFTSDNCAIDSVWSQYPIDNFYPCGNTVVQCYVRDIYGNESGCSFNVSVLCETANVFKQEIMCGDSAAGYDFCIYVANLNGATSGDCSLNVTNNQSELIIDQQSVVWTNDTAKITGSIGSTRPIPSQLNLQVDLACTCPAPGNEPSNITLPVNFTTPCCDSVYIEGQEVCGQDASLYLSLNGTIDLANIAQTIWYVQEGPCPPIAAGLPIYQSSIGYADLQLLPEYYTSDVCVYAEVVMANGPCTKLITNLDTIEICKPVTCALKDTAYCYSGTPIIPEPLCIELNQNGQDCEYSIIWLDENGDTIPGENGLKYQPPTIDFVGPADACAYEVTYTAIISSVCGNSSCTSTIRLDNDNAAVGQLSISYPTTAMPYCPGQDATINYSPACVGEPPMWFWHESTDGVNFTALPLAGNQNPVYNTNRLFQTTWFMVTKQNGVCTTLDSTIIKIDIKDTLKIAQFTAVPLDVCRTTGVGMSVDFNPCTTGTSNSCDCDYEIDWYKDGQLLHTANYTNSPATFDYMNAVPNNDYGGNYYAVVKNNCCAEIKKTAVIPIDPPMIVAALGPCFQCFNETVNLEGIVENPVGNCTYQWYEIVNGTESPINNAVNLTFQTSQAGTYIFEVTCGTCIERDTVAFEQCADECINDVIAPMVFCNSLAIDLSGGAVEVFPSDLDGGSSDNCGIASISLGKTLFDCSNIGTNTVTLTVTDLSGNSSSCTTTVLVQDNQGSCGCDGTNIVVSGQPIVPDEYTVSQAIISRGTVATTTTVLFQAGENITLLPGFTAETGANFTARIAPCVTNLKAPETEVETAKVLLKTIPVVEDIALSIQPNPFKYQTTLVLNLSEMEMVNLRVFDQSGRMLIELLKDAPLTSGIHEIPLQANHLKGGMYYINLQTATSNIMKKVILISDGGNWKGDDD